MRGTTIIYAHPETLRIMAEEQVRFSPSTTGLLERARAAWKVFTGKADALSWEEWPDNANQKKVPCPGCDGHECDNGCAYPGVNQQLTREG